MFTQVLQHFTPPGMQQERLAYFATAEGRDDLYRCVVCACVCVCEVCVGKECVCACVCMCVSVRVQAR